MAMSGKQRDKLTEEIEKNNYYDKISLEKVHIEKKNRERNFARKMNECYTQQQLLDEEEKRRVRPLLREEAIKKEENLAFQVAKLKNEQIRDLKMRQLLRQNCPELRQLEAKLKTAYVTKELAAQIAEKEAHILNEKIREKQALELLENARTREEELKKERAQEEIIRKNKYKLELQDQMILHEKSIRCKYEEFLREKKMLDDIIQRLHEEDERALEEKMLKMQRTREEMMAFKAAQEIWKKRERDALEEENRKIQEYLQSKAGSVKARQEEKERREAIKAKISGDMAKKIAEDEAKRREREQMLQDLLEAEEREALEQKHKEEVEREFRRRIETHDSLMRQMEERRVKLRQEAEEDARYKEQLIAKVAEDERLEQLSAEKKRLKMLQLRKDVEESIQERRRKRAEEMQLISKLIEEEEKSNEERRKRIEEERLRMLREHAEHLLGYLPKGVLRFDDLDQLGGNFKEKFLGKKY